MRAILKIIFITLFSIQIVQAQQCETSFTKSAVDKLADNWFGLKCDPLDSKTWQPGWSSCDCIKKGEKFTRIKEAFFQKNRDKRASAIKNLLEKKVADVLRSQIDSGFDQSLRLDTLLKQGVLSINEKHEVNDFPKNCRAGKVGDVIKEALKNSEINLCNKDVLNKRLKMFLNGKKNFDEYLTGKMDTYKNASMNTISKKDKDNGMCIPYKSFQSLNNINPQRETYLAVAKSKGNFANFQKWATDRSRPDDVNDSGSRLEKIDRETILHLVKTDPIFERMVKDEKFYNDVNSGVFAKNGQFDENNPALISSMVQSQDRQCVKLYGQSELGNNQQNAAKEVVVKIKKGTQQLKPEGITSAKEEPNLLTQYLCDEDFPKKFLNDDTIRNVLAPEFKEEGEIKGLKHTEAIIAKWAYCSEDKVDESVDGAIAMTMVNGEAPKKAPAKATLTDFLNLSLNPKTDLDIDNSKDNEYAKFNKLTCPYIPQKCKDLDVSMVDFDCSTAHIAGDIAQNILSKSVGAEFEVKMNDRSISDKDLREMLRKTNKLSSDQISALLILRNQSIDAKYARAKEDLKKALGLKPEENIDQYIAAHGGEDKVLSDPRVTSEIRRKVNDKYLGYVRDNIYSESIDDNQSSYFSNYFALGDSTDEKAIVATASQSNGTGGSQTPSTPSLPSSSGTSTAATGDNSTGLITDSSGSAPIYKRRSFDEPATRDQSSQRTITPPVDHTFAADKPADKVPEPKPATTKKEEPKEVVKPAEEIAKNDIKTEPVADSGNAKSFSSNNSFYLSSSSSSSSNKSKEGDEENATTKQLENRLDYLQKLAAEEEAKKKGNDQSNKGITNPEIEELRDQIAREKTRIANQNRTNTNNASRNRNDNGSSLGGSNAGNFSGNNNFSNNGSNNSSSGNDANAYDPLDRATTGRRDLKEKDPKAMASAAAGKDKEKDEESSAAASSEGGASGKNLKKALTAGGSGGGIDGASVGSGGGVTSKGARYPAQDNGESDPDDICGYDQKVACYFEYASIDVLSPSIGRFVEYIQLQGRSFMALEVYKYKNKKMPTKYFIHEYEPAANMSEEDKNQLYLKVKKLSLDYKKNRLELKKIASMVVEVKKREVTKEEVKELSKNILRLPDLNRLSARRARHQ